MSFSKSIKVAKFNVIDSLTTPFIHLDFSLGKGLGEGKWIETFAPEGIGKTTLNFQIASFILDLRKDMELLFIDAEMSMTDERIQNIAYQETFVDIETGAILIEGKERGTIVRPETYEQVDYLFDEFTKYCAKSQKKGIILWDSLVALTTEKMLTKGKDRLAVRATAIQELIEKYIAKFSKLGITLLVINQVRDRIEADMFASTKGDGAMVDTEYHVPGGRAHKFWSFQSLMLAKGQKWKEKADWDTSIFRGRLNRIIPTKNKFGVDRQEVQIVYIPEIGYSNVLTILDDLRKEEVIKGKGYYAMEVPGLDRKVRLDDYLKILSEDKNEAKRLHEMIFNVLVKRYKVNSPEKFNIEEQIRAIQLDANKLYRYYLNKTEENPDLLENED